MFIAPPLYLVRRDKQAWLDPLFESKEEAKAAAIAQSLDPEKAVEEYPGPSGRFPYPMHQAWIAHMTRNRYVVPKADLEDGAWYIGRCRNANLAQWDAKRSVFVHWREKFGRLFPETINHPEDDDGFDLFWPIAPLEPTIELKDIRGRDHAATFKRYIGIDYSGAETPTSGLVGLQVFTCERHETPKAVANPAGGGRKWTRKAVAHWLLEQLASGPPTIVGIDHAFSFPASYLDRYNLRRWDQFLEDFAKHWPTDDDNTYVDFIRDENPQRIGQPKEFRLTERWCSSAQSVFRFDGQGTVGKSSHAGIPWLRFLRKHEKLKGKVHFWPFDGFLPPAGQSVIAEVYPSIFKKRYPIDEACATPHAVDACAIARWLSKTDWDGFLPRYFQPPFVDEESVFARREGWILGVS